MDEATLIKGWQSGNAAAFDELYQRHALKALRTAYLITGNRQLAEDVVQETFVQCYLHLYKLKNAEKFSSWLYKILVRNCWRYLSREKAKHAAETLDDGLVEQLADRVDQYERVDSADTHKKLYQAINRLSQPLREVVVFYYFHDLPIKEIAAILGCLETTVKTRLFKARKNLERGILSEIYTGQKAGELHDKMEFI